MNKMFPKSRKEFKKYHEIHKDCCALVGFILEGDDLVVASNTACHASLGYSQQILERKGGYMNVDKYGDIEEVEEEYDYDYEYEGDEE